MAAIKGSYSDIKWARTLFICLLPVITALAVFYVCYWQSSPVPYQTWILTVVLFFYSTFSITAGYHRLFSHKSYKASKVLRIILLIGATMSFQESALTWANIHREHHKYEDTPLDPHDINEGLFYAHCGWLFTLSKDKYKKFNSVTDLAKDPLIKLQHKYYRPLSVIFGGVGRQYFSFFFLVLERPASGSRNTWELDQNPPPCIFWQEWVICQRGQGFAMDLTHQLKCFFLRVCAC